MTLSQSSMSVRCPNCSHQVDFPPGASGSDSSSPSTSSCHPSTLPRSHAPESLGCSRGRRQLSSWGPVLGASILSRSASVNGDVYTNYSHGSGARSHGDVHTDPKSSHEDIYSYPHNNIAKCPRNISRVPRLGNGRAHNTTTASNTYTRTQSEYHENTYRREIHEYHEPYRETFSDREGEPYQNRADLMQKRSRPRTRTTDRGPRTHSLGSTLSRGSSKRNGHVVKASCYDDSSLCDDFDDVFLHDSNDQNTRHNRNRNHSNHTFASRGTSSGSRETTSDFSTLDHVLSHIDFWPSTLFPAESSSEADFEEFDVLLERANRWTKQFPSYDIISCETVSKKVRDVQEIYSASMEYRDEEHTMPQATHIKGLRLWHRQRTKKSRSAPDVICSFDTQPQMLRSGSNKRPIYESLTGIVERINARLKEYPLQGEILGVESVCLKIPEHEWSISYEVNTLSCSAADEYHCHQVMFIRLFYVLGPSTHVIVGVKDFTPHVIDAGGIFHPAHYAPLFSLVSSAQSWLSINRDIDLVSVQTLETKHRKKSENQGNRFNTERMFEFKIDERFRAYFIRVTYTRPLHPTTTLISNPVTHLTCRTFQPQDKMDGQKENITEVLARMEKFLMERGTRPIYIESQIIPEWMTLYEFAEQGDRTFFDGEWYFLSDKDGNPRGPYRHPLLYVIRVYYDGEFDEPQHAQMATMPAECCRLM